MLRVRAVRPSVADAAYGALAGREGVGLLAAQLAAML